MPYETLSHMRQSFILKFPADSMSYDWLPSEGLIRAALVSDLLTELRQVALDVDGGCAAESRRSHGLAINVI